MVCKNFLIHLWLILTLIVGQANCFMLAQNRKVKFGETFTLQLDEMVETEDAKLKIRLKDVGREISASDEVEYVELQVRLNKSEQLIVIRERTEGTKTVGDFVIELINAESFGDNHYCQLKISRKV